LFFVYFLNLFSFFFGGVCFEIALKVGVIKQIIPCEWQYETEARCPEVPADQQARYKYIFRLRLFIYDRTKPVPFYNEIYNI